jgi:integrase
MWSRGDGQVRLSGVCVCGGTPLDAHNVRRAFRKVVDSAGLVGREWTPRELRHSFVSLLSDDGMPIEQISRLVGHTNTTVTEAVYRLQISPVIIEGAEAMDHIFGHLKNTTGQA